MNNTQKLSEFIFVMSTITCSKCKRQDELMGETDETSEAWDIEGWHVSKDKVYCPDCNQKRIDANVKRIVGKMKKSPAKKKKPAYR